MDLLERAEPLGALDDALADARAGTGRMVLLTGEAGIGKTSLAREFGSRHDDVDVWWGACDALSTPRPLGPLYDIAATAGGEVAALMAADATRFERFSGFLHSLGSPFRPVIVVIEDVHWADEATRDLLIFLGRRLDNTSAVVVVTFRDDEIGRDHPLRIVLGHLARIPAVRRVALERLSVPAVAQLARDEELGERIHTVTAGNPFFVTEVLAAGDGVHVEVPVTVTDAVLTRVSRLSPAARNVLYAAAVVPDRCELSLVRAMTEADAEAVDECFAAGLLEPDGAAVRFRHELARLSVETSTPVVLRTDLHARALARLSTTAGVDAARLAYHAELADDQQAIREYAPVAARRAADDGAHREAAAHYRRALDHAEGFTDRERAELWESYAEECMAVDRAWDAIDATAHAVELWEAVGDRDRAAVSMARRAYVLWAVGNSDEAKAAVRASIELAEHRPDGVSSATAYTYAAHLQMLAREIPEAIRLGERGAELAERLGEPALLARALIIVGAAMWFADPERAEATLLRGLEVARNAGDDTLVGLAMRMLGSAPGEIRQYATADRWLREGIEWCTEHDLDIHGDYCLSWLARSAFEQGRWSEAGALAGDALTRPSEHAPTRITALTVLGRLRVRRGDPGADDALSEAWELAQRTGDLQRLWPAAAGRAETAWLAGHPETIAGLVSDTYELAQRLGQPWPIGELGFWLWRGGELDALPAAAADPYRSQVSGDWAAAAAAWASIGCPYEEALALADSDDAVRLTSALEVFAGLGARPMADRIAARLRHLGVRRLPRQPTRTTVDNPGGLTTRQLEVVALLADGRTNAEIAAMLHISAKTAAHHVSAILTKLDVSSRRDVVRAAREQGIVTEK